MATFYQVGGSVRDELLGVKSKDIDYAVEAESFDAMREAVLARGGEIFQEAPKYFTIRAKVPNLGACDFTLCRRDGDYKDGRHPETVGVGTIQEDLARRDFSINAIAKREDGTLVDPFRGVDHLRMRLLTCVGSPVARFTEDGLRMVRALRFIITKGLEPDVMISACLRSEMFFEERMRGVSVERVRDELYKCFYYDTPHTLGVLAKYPEFAKHLFYVSPLWLEPTLRAR